MVMSQIYIYVYIVWSYFVYGFNGNYNFVNSLTKDSNFLKLVCDLYVLVGYWFVITVCKESGIYGI
jgi:hypothetical protein